MSQEEIMAMLWGITKTLSEADTTYESGDDTECVFCCGTPGYGLIAYKHQERCPVSLARLLMKEQGKS